MTIKDAAISIIRADLNMSVVQDYRRRGLRATWRDTRTTPTEAQVWRRYCFSMITRQQRVSDSFWSRVFADRTWSMISESYPTKRLQFLVLQDTLHLLKIRFADDKARQICSAWDRDFGAISNAMRTVLSRYHDRGHSEKCRPAELLVTHVIQATLSGCGVGPKIARLMMLWNPGNGMGLDFRHVIPIDSRWVHRLTEIGVDPLVLDTSTESNYRKVEADLVAAAYELSILPFEADGIVFGWMGS